MKPKSILLTCLFLVSIHLQAHTYEIEKERFTAKDGLSSNTINCILQDKAGYIWIGTPNGLDRYDGHSFWNFSKEPENHRHLQGEGIIGMHEDKSNQLLWVFTADNQAKCINLKDFTLIDYNEKGENEQSFPHYHAGKLYLWRYGKKNRCQRIRIVNNKFVIENFKRQIRQICSDEEGNDWILSEKGIYLNGFEERLPESDSVRQIVPYHGLCIGITHNKVIIYNHSRRVVRKAELPKSLQGASHPIEATVWLDKLLLLDKGKTHAYEIIDGSFSTPPDLQFPDGKVIRQDESHMAYITDSKGTLYRLGKEGNVHKWSITPERGNTSSQWHITCLDQSTEALAAYGKGLYLLNVDNGELTHYHKEDQSRLISNNRLTGLLTDHSGSLWLIEENLGLSLLHVNNQSSQRHYIQSGQTLSETNNLTTLTRNGEQSLCITNRRNEVYSYDLLRNKSSLLFQTKETIQCAISDKEYHVWLGTSNGVWYDTTPLKPFWPDSLPQMNVCAISADEDGNIYLGLQNGGLVKTSRNNDKGFEFSCICPTHEPVRTITHDKQGRIWMTTSQELLIFNPDSSDTPLRFNLNSTQAPMHDIVSASCSPEGDIQIGTHGYGLFSCTLSGEELHCQQIPIAEGVNINSLPTDTQGSLWVATDEGLSLISHQGYDIRNFNFHDNPLGNLYSPNAYAFIGENLYLATSDGFVFIRTNSIPDPNTPLTVYITSVSSGNDTQYSCNEPIEFDYTRDELTFHFSNLHYDKTRKVHHQYRLDGIDHDWSSPSEACEASYRNLSPGKYVFHVRSVYGHNHWSPETYCSLTIKRPWWSTWPVMAGCLTLFCLLGVLFRYLWKKNDHISPSKYPTTSTLAADGEIVMSYTPHLPATETSTTPQRDKRFIERIKFILEEEGCQPDFTVEELGRRMGLGRTRFYTRVKEATGQTPSELLRLYRLETAARLLIETDDNIEEIREKCGFGNATNFYNYFKRQYGLSPQRYRKSEGSQ